MRLQQRSLSKLGLMDILRRKKKTLKDFLTDSGIAAYETLAERCSSMGVTVPDVEMFNLAIGKKSEIEFAVSSPTEGIILLEPPPIVEETTGKQENIEDLDPPSIEVEIITQQDKKKKKQK